MEEAAGVQKRAVWLKGAVAHNPTVSWLVALLVGCCLVAPAWLLGQPVRLFTLQPHPGHQVGRTPGLRWSIGARLTFRLSLLTRSS